MKEKRESTSDSSHKQKKMKKEMRETRGGQGDVLLRETGGGQGDVLSVLVREGEVRSQLADLRGADVRLRVGMRGHARQCASPGTPQRQRRGPLGGMSRAPAHSEATLT